VDRVKGLRDDGFRKDNYDDKDGAYCLAFFPFLFLYLALSSWKRTVWVGGHGKDTIS